MLMRHPHQASVAIQFWGGNSRLRLQLMALIKITNTATVQAGALSQQHSKSSHMCLNKASPVGGGKWQMWQERRGTEETLKKISGWLNAAHSCQSLPIKSTRWSKNVFNNALSTVTKKKRILREGKRGINMLCSYCGRWNECFYFHAK